MLKKRRLSSEDEFPSKRRQTDEVAMRLHALNLGAPVWDSRAPRFPHKCASDVYVPPRPGPHLTLLRPFPL